MVNVITLPLGAYQTNCYIAWGDDSDTCIVIDPGYTPEKVLEETRKLGKRIEAVLLTHGHFDHVGGVRTIGQLTGCDVYIHEKELSLPESFTAGPLFYTDTYAEGDVIEMANLSIRVLYTPGHTAGSVCLAVGETLFSGDTLFQGSCGRTDLPGGNGAQIFQSLQRLAALTGDYRVLPGHGDETTLSAERQYNPYLQ